MTKIKWLGFSLVPQFFFKNHIYFLQQIVSYAKVDNTCLYTARACIHLFTLMYANQFSWWAINLYTVARLTFILTPNQSCSSTCDDASHKIKNLIDYLSLAICGVVRRQSCTISLYHMLYDYQRFYRMYLVYTVTYH